MSRIVSIFRFSLSVAALLIAAPPAAHTGELECSDKQVSARGLGFEPSPELSMEAAKKEWLKKATEVYSDATVATAKDPQVMCASQGLYSNCTITGFPCGTKPVAPKGN
ncbi:MAG TPA: hypothetical protein VGY14_01030 [Methyloceanibacter sp.]|jgi:hypothetical protein|nr:hypothetical protein [Methyloceanibacter sp.]